MTTPQPFKIDVPDATICQILERVRLYEWPEAPEDGGWAYGTSLDYMKELAAYWVKGYVSTTGCGEDEQRCTVPVGHRNCTTP